MTGYLNPDSVTNDESGKPITRQEVIGGSVKKVYYINLPRVEGPNPDLKDFQSRIIVFELMSGLVFDLNQPVNFDAASGSALIFRRSSFEGLETALDVKKDKNLKSPIVNVVSSKGWAYHFGLLLENGFTLTGAVSMWDEGLRFYKPNPQTFNTLVVLNLPEGLEFPPKNR